MDNKKILATLLRLQRRIRTVCVEDIASELKLEPPSANAVVMQLVNDGYALKNSAGHITITRQGNEIAMETFKRQRIIAAMLMDLGVSEEISFIDALNVEENFSEESISCIAKRYQKREPKKIGALFFPAKNDDKKGIRYIHLYIAQREIAYGEGVNVMLLARNTSDEDELHDIKIFILPIDIAGAKWKQALCKKELLQKKQASHIYLTISGENFLKENWGGKHSDEFAIYAGEKPPESGLNLGHLGDLIFVKS